MRKWRKLTVQLDPVLVESVSDFLVGVMGAGVEAVEEGKGDLQVLNVWEHEENHSEEEFQQRMETIMQHTATLAEIFHTQPPEITWEMYEEEDWSTGWKKYFTPFAIVPGLVIVPTWEHYHAEGDEKVLVMDPGMAFGTGHHGTTTLAVELVRESLERQAQPVRVLDVGTGTGILGMAAALWGADEVLAIDNDPVAVAVAASNTHLNGLEGLMRVRATPLADIAGQYELVIANIVHDVLIDLADELARVTAEGGELILSGILVEGQTDSIRLVFEEKGLELKDLRTSGEWAAMRLAKTGMS